MSRAEKSESKKVYEQQKAVQTKINNGEPTTFLERNYLNIYLKRQAKKKKQVA